MYAPWTAHIFTNLGTFSAIIDPSPALLRETTSTSWRGHYVEVRLSLVIRSLSA